MKITIINHKRKEKRFTSEEHDTSVAQLHDGTYRHRYARDYSKEVCFTTELLPTFTITKRTDMEVGWGLARMGNRRARCVTGTASVIQEMPFPRPKQVVLVKRKRPNDSLMPS